MKHLSSISLVLFFSLLGLEMHAQTTIYYRYDGSGNRKYRGIDMTITNGRISDTASTKKPVGDTLKTAQYQIKVYPNPTSGELYVDVAGLEPDKSTSYQVVDLRGITIIEGKVGEQTTIGLLGKAAGIYLLKVYIGKDQYEWKIIKQ